MNVDCQACGACCVAFVVDVDEHELDRMPHPRRNLLTSRDSQGRLIMRLTKKLPVIGGGRCAAFKGQAGDECSCTIYESRPQVCRDFTPERDACNRARRRAGLPPMERVA